MPIHTCKSHAKRILKNGVEKVYTYDYSYEVKGPKISEQKIKEIQELAKLGVRPGIICKKYGLSYPTVAKYAKMGDQGANEEIPAT